LTFTINAPAPFLSTLSPRNAMAGNPGFTLTVNGSHFVAGSVVRWNGSDRATAFPSSSALTASIPASDLTVAGTAQVTVFNPPPSGGASNTLDFLVTGPAINPGGTVNGASFAGGMPVTPGSIVSLFGATLAFEVAAAARLPLPNELADTSVRLNGIDAPLFFVSPTQINFQIPWELAGQTEVSIAVKSNGGMSQSQTLNLASVNPGIFAVNGENQGAVLIAATGELAAPAGSITGRAARPVSRGEFISIFCTGLGAVSNPPVSGTAASADPLATTTETPTVTIGGAAAPVSFSGLGPGFVSLYQVNAQVPADAPTGDAVGLTLTMSGVTSNTVSIAVQ
jgi:uncharacterized protein (TIGR03437 family)